MCMSCTLLLCLSQNWVQLRYINMYDTITRYVNKVTRECPHPIHRQTELQQCTQDHLYDACLCRYVLTRGELLL